MLFRHVLNRPSRCFSLPTKAFLNAFVYDKTPIAGEKKTMKIFSRPTQYRLAKFILSQDETVRIDILKTFSGIDSLSSAVQLDEHYNPFDPLHFLRNFLNLKSTQGLFEAVKDSTKVEVFSDGKIISQSSSLQGICNALFYNFPDSSRSTVDFLCKTDFGHIIIEFQVAKQGYRNNRALASVSNLYGQQLRPGESYYHIQNVIGINILGDGSTPCWKDGNFKRDYTFVDQLNPKIKIPTVRLIQYSLGDADLDHPELRENKKLRDWIEYFKSAHEKDSPPSAIEESVQKAYDLVRIDFLKSQHPELLIFRQDDQAVEAIGIEIGIFKVAKGLLKDGVSVEVVARNTGLTEVQVQSLK